MHVFRAPGLAFDVDPARLEWRETEAEGVGWLPLHLASPSGGRSRSEDDPPPEATVNAPASASTRPVPE